MHMVCHAGQQLCSSTCQQGLNEDAALGAQLPVEAAEHGAHNAQRDAQVGRLHARLTCGVQQVLQLRDEQLRDAHQQRMLKGRHRPARMAATQMLSHRTFDAVLQPCLCMLHAVTQQPTTEQ